MAPPLVVTNAAQVRLGYDLEGEVAYNILNFEMATPLVVNGGLADQVGTAVKAAFTAQWRPHVNSLTRLVRVGIRDLRTANNPEYLDNQAAVVGSAVADRAPRAASVVVTLRTAGAGKSFRGRVYVPGVSSSESLNGNQTSAVTLAAAAYINDIASRLQPIGLFLAVMSRPSDDIVTRQITTRDGAVVQDRVLSHVTAKTGRLSRVTLVESRNNRWEYQRRRDNGRGQGVSSLSQSAASFVINPGG